MSDHIPDGEVNLYRHMGVLRKDVYKQTSSCCWAIAVSTGVSYTYYKNERDPDFELSPQDVLDRVWYYSSLQKRALFEYDNWGAYFCNHSKAYRYINSKGVSFLRDYSFVGRLSENIQPIKSREVPRVYCTQFESLTLEEAIRAAENSIPVTAAVEVTDRFKNYRRGDPVYEKAPSAHVRGTHSVLIIGVNVEEGYFRIRNSWGPGWGDNGYGLIKFNSLSRFSCASSAWMEPYIRAV